MNNFKAAAVCAKLMAVSMAGFYIMSMLMPKLFCLGDAVERFAYLYPRTNLRALAWSLAFVWAMAAIPVGLTLYQLKQRLIAAAFWFIGLTVQFVAYTVMLGLVYGVIRGYLNSKLFIMLDSLGLWLGCVGMMLLSVGMLVYGLDMFKEKGLLKYSGGLFIASGLACLIGGPIVILSSLGLAVPLIGTIGLLLHGAIGKFLFILAFGVLAWAWWQQSGQATS
jgi:hypothetical protein